MSEDEAVGFVDTKLLVYAFEKEDSERNRVSRNLLNRLMQTGTSRLSTLALQESCVTMTQIEGSGVLSGNIGVHGRSASLDAADNRLYRG